MNRFARQSDVLNGRWAFYWRTPSAAVGWPSHLTALLRGIILVSNSALCAGRQAGPPRLPRTARSVDLAANVKIAS